MKLRFVASLLLVSAGIYWVLQSPYELVNPGSLIKGHSKIESDCFKCHIPLLGPSNGKCAVCHKWTYKNAKNKTSAALHRHLIKKDCLSCHTDHMEAAAAGAIRRFDHSLLERSFLSDCRQCHAKPTDDLHRSLYYECNSCHLGESWGRVTFDHARYFKLDPNHPPSDCVKCHIGGNYARYTCYGCHQHSEDKVGNIHHKNGIQYFGNCVGCHRDALKATLN